MRAPLRLLLPLLVLATACTDKANVTPPVTEPEPKPEPKIVGVYDFHISGIAGDQPNFTVEPMTGPEGEIGAGLNASLSQVGAGLVFETASWGRLSENLKGHANGHRYIWISYRVRNATGAPLNNVTFIPGIFTNTVAGTPYRQIFSMDGSLADTLIVRQMVPTGQVMLADGLRLTSPTQDVLQVFLESEVASLPKPASALSYFPYGFMVRNITAPHGRQLPPAENNQQYDGMLTIAFRIPLLPVGSEDIADFTVRMVAFQDGETRLTESIEEGQDTAAVRRLRARATALGATTVTVLAGSTALDPAIANYPGQRQICSVRTAGPPESPVTFITNPGPHADFMVLNPGETMDPCAPRFRAGSPGRPATNVPYNLTVHAVDRYGNIIPVRDTIRIEIGAGSPPATYSDATRLSSAGSATMTMTYSDYGTAQYAIRGRRILSTPNTVPVAGVTRTWTAGAGTTSWHTGGNWLNGAVPMSLDSVLIPAAAPLFPQLASNVTVRGVTVENGATLSLGAFDLTAGANVATGTSGGINGSVGRVILTGTAATVRGNLPRMRVLGTYSLDGNVTAVAPTRVESGRLRSGSFRMRTASQ